MQIPARRFQPQKSFCECVVIYTQSCLSIIFLLNVFFVFFVAHAFFYLLFPFRTPETPIELAIDFILHDFEMAGTIRSILTVNSLLDSEKKNSSFSNSHTTEKIVLYLFPLNWTLL